MGLYDNLKDIALVLQKADNVDLYKQLIELSSQALDIQNQLVRLSQENQELKDELGKVCFGGTKQIPTCSNFVIFLTRTPKEIR